MMIIIVVVKLNSKRKQNNKQIIRKKTRRKGNQLRQHNKMVAIYLRTLINGKNEKNKRENEKYFLNTNGIF